MSRRRRLTDEERSALIVEALPHGLSPDEAADVAALARALGDPSVWGATNRALEDRVVDAVLGAQPSALAPVTALGSTTGPARRRAKPRRRRMIMSAAAAAIVAIAIAAGILDARRDPDADFRSRLSATSLAPTARAAADMYQTNAGFRIELHAHGLPTLSGDAYFQGWLRNRAGTEVPIGTFSSSAGDVTLWSGVSPKDYRTLTVTIETPGHDQLPSARRVLAGEVEDT